MRRFAVLFALSIFVSSTALAQETPQSSSVSVPPAPAVKAVDPMVAPMKNPAAPGAMVTLPPEPNLKGIKDSGGKSNSYMIKDAPLPSDYVLGKPTAPLVIVEYASMSCPHCAHFSNTVLPELEKRYIDTGKVKYVLRQFPLNEPALKAAMLLDCVGTQDKNKYYVFSKVLFEAQNKWAFDTNYMAGLETIANVGGLSKDQFARCTNNTDREMKMLKEKQMSNDELHVPHTPYIFIGGESYEGDRDIEHMAPFIDAKLAELQKK